MKTGTYYFYTSQTKKIPDKGTGLVREHYTVIKVNIYKGNVDEANRKAKTLNNQLGFGEMPGGFFNETCKTSLKYYTVIDCPNNTKIQPYTEHDKFIIALIEHEENMPFILI